MTIMRKYKTLSDSIKGDRSTSLKLVGGYQWMLIYFSGVKRLYRL